MADTKLSRVSHLFILLQPGVPDHTMMVKKVEHQVTGRQDTVDEVCKGDKI